MINSNHVLNFDFYLNVEIIWRTFMSKKHEAIKKAVFYAQQKPDDLATILDGVVSDTVAKVVVTGDDSITIPASDSVSKTYSAKVYSSFGDEMTGQTITYALVESVTGVSISGAIVTVASTCTATSFGIKATCGTVIGTKTVALVAAS